MIFIEVLDRRGRVAHRVRLDALPATVGRGYHNTVIVDDRYVSPEHLRLDRDDTGALIAEDLATENGLYLDGHHQRLARATLVPGTRLRIGHTVLRIVTTDYRVPRAVPEPFAGHPQGRLLLSPRGGLLLASTAVTAQILSSWLTTFQKLIPARLLSDGLLALLVLALWAGGWALATRWRAPSGMFLPHLALASAAAVVGDLFQLLHGFAVAAAPDLADSLFSVLGGVAALGLATGLLYGHLALATNLTPRARTAWALGLIVTVSATVRFVSYAERDRAALGVTFAATLRSLPPGLVRSTALEPYLAGLVQLQQRVDTMAVESP